MKKQIAAVAIYLVLCASFQVYGESWQKIETTHLVFIFEEENRAHAEYLSSVGEEIYTKVSDFYDSYPKKIFTVLDGHSNFYQNLFQPFPAHINITISAPTWPWFGSRYGDWLEMVFIHELTHAVQTPYENGPFAFLAKIFGPGLKSVPGGFLPAFASEGPAVLLETLFTSGGRGRTQFFEMLSKAMILDDDFFTYLEAGSTSPFGPPSRPYVAGYLFANHIYEQYGSSALRNIHNRFVQFPFFGPRDAIRRATGKSVEQHFHDIRESLTARYADDIRVKGGEKISGDQFGDYYLPFATDTGWILYRSTPDSPRAIIRFNPVTKEEEILAVVFLTDPSSFGPNPAGTSVAFTANSPKVHSRGYEDYSDLFLLNTETGAQSRVTKGSHLWHPALSSDESFAVAVAAVGSNSALVRVDLADGTVKLLFWEAGTSVFNPSLSEDGKTVVFAIKKDGSQDIYALPLSVPTIPFRPGPEQLPESINIASLTKVTDTETSEEYFPRISGNSVVFSSDRAGSLGVYRKLIGSDKPAVVIAEDPVGAYAGMTIGNETIYAAYTTGGFALKRTTGTARTAEAEEDIASGPPKSREMTGPVGSGNSEIQTTESSYFDYPRLILWAPIPLSLNPYAPSPLPIGRLPTGAGAYFLAQSTVYGNDIEGYATFDWASLQPGIDISGGIQMGLVPLRYNVTSGFTALSVNEFDQTIQAAAGILYPIFYHYRFPDTTQIRISGSAGVAHTTLANQSFPYLQPPPLAINTTTLFWRWGTQLVTGKLGAMKDFYPPFLFSVWADVEGYLTVSPVPEILPVYSAGTYLQFRSFIPHQVVGVGLDSTYTPWSSSGSVMRDPRAGFSFATSGHNASFLLGLDYRFNIALVDWQLPFGYSIDQLAGSIFIESAAVWAAQTGDFTPYPGLFPGFELVLNVGSVGRTPVGIGTSARIDLVDPESFLFFEDIKVYVFLGAGGFQRGGFAREGFRDIDVTGRPGSGFLDHPSGVSYPKAR